MSLLNIFRRKPVALVEHVGEKNVEDIDKPISQEPVLQEVDKSQVEIEIPEDVFVEYEHPNKKRQMDTQNATERYDLDRLYQFLNQSLEKKGYEDALINPDSSYMEQQVRVMQNELNLLVSRIQSDYRTHLNNIDFHVESRKRSGMVETVEELLAHRKSIEEDVALVSEIFDAAKKGEGLSQNIIISYKRGFHNGFAAITFNSILNRRK